MTAPLTTFERGHNLPPFDPLKLYTTTKARLKTKHSFQRGTRCTRYNKNWKRPAQTTQTCHASFPLTVPRMSSRAPETKSTFHLKRYLDTTGDLIDDSLLRELLLDHGLLVEFIRCNKTRLRNKMCSDTKNMHSMWPCGPCQI